MIEREPTTIPQRSGSRRLLTILAIVVLVVLLVARQIATFWTDFLWFDSVQLTSVWTTLIWTRVQLVIIASLVAFVLIWGTLALADRLSPRRGVFTGSPDEELLQRFQDWIETRVGRVRTGVAAFFGVMIGLGAAAWWEHFLLFRNGGSFGLDDPVFANDIGLYVFNLPFYRDLFGWAFQLFLVMALLTAALHYLNGAIQVQTGERSLRAGRVNPGVKVHLSVLFAILAALKAVGYQLDKWELLYSDRGRVTGASFTDVNAQLPALNLLILISLVAAVILLVNIWFRGWTLPLVAGGLWLFTSIAVGGLYPAIIQQFRVVPNEIERELEFVDRNIEFTRSAYGLDQAQVLEFASSPNLTGDDVAANAPTFDNVRLWDPGVLQTTYEQLQELKQYYQITDVDVDRYPLEQGLSQVMVSARELDQANAPGDWVNQHLVYTHGFGAVVSPAAAVTPEGQPAFLVQDIPPESADPSLAIEQPRIYFGDSAGSSFVIVGTNERELDFPQETGVEAVAFNTYDGAGGVPLGGVFRRLAFALRFSDINTLISSQLRPDSKVLMVRDVRERIQKVAPFLRSDADPYLVIDDGRLVWVVDLYTLTDQYPYSERADTSRLVQVGSQLPNGFNYIRNSVKAVVDAYDGTMTFYIVDETDPVILAYERIFPDLFTAQEDLSDSLRSHLRYPEELFRIQSDMYRTYHVTDPREFFNGADEWQIARDPSSGEGRAALRGEGTFLDDNQQSFVPMLPYYLLMRLPNDDELSFIIMQPFTPLNRPNMVSFLVAKSGPAEYGDLVDFTMPRNRLVKGPGQVGALIDQDPVISREFTLLGQEGSEVVKGSMLVVPVDESVVYVQPIYIKAKAEENGPAGLGQVQSGSTAVPEFKRAVVVFEDEIIMRDTLNEALATVFGVGVSPPTVPGTDDPEPGGELPGDIEELVAQATAAFERADAALQSGDLAGYEQAIEEAQRLVEEVQRLLAEANS